MLGYDGLVLQLCMCNIYMHWTFIIAIIHMYVHFIIDIMTLIVIIMVLFMLAFYTKITIIFVELLEAHK